MCVCVKHKYRYVLPPRSSSLPFNSLPSLLFTLSLPPPISFFPFSSFIKFPPLWPHQRERRRLCAQKNDSLPCPSHSNNNNCFVGCEYFSSGELGAINCCCEEMGK